MDVVELAEESARARASVAFYRSPETFGRCEPCGTTIAFERLDALPCARTCIARKQREENAAGNLTMCRHVLASPSAGRRRRRSAGGRRGTPEAFGSADASRTPRTFRVRALRPARRATKRVRTLGVHLLVQPPAVTGVR